MASISLKNVSKIYKGGVEAVHDFNMDIADGEFIVFVGPSGCGKSTTLRMIAGLEDITSGELFINDKYVNDLEPKDRNLAMVFQNYALYPYLNVHDNIAFGLKLRHTPKKIIDEKVNEVAHILGLEDLLLRKPGALSGGQRQRVALGRAIVREAQVYLFDEPLSNLDAKLRAAMRVEIIRLYERLKTTFIYVTHDQVEAMTMGTRIVVMKNGIVQQIDTPTNLYDYPKNKFVAGFIGTPQMNFFAATLQNNHNEHVLRFGENQDITLNLGKLPIVPEYNEDGKKEVIFGIRSEHLHVAADDENGFEAHVRLCETLGSECLVYLTLTMGSESLDGEGDFVIKIQGRVTYKNGDIVKVAVDKEHVSLFAVDSEESILLR